MKTHRWRWVGSVTVALLLGVGVLFLARQAHAAIAGSQYVLTGRVLTDETTPRPVQNALIQATHLSAGGETASALTDANGDYTITLPASGIWYVQALKTTATLPATAEAPRLGKQVTFLTPATKTANFTFHVSAQGGSGIRGRVLISGTPPIPAPFTVTVKAIAFPWPGHNCPTVFGSASTTANPTTGEFTLPVSPGCYKLVVIPANIAFLPPNVPPVEVGSGSTVDVGDLYLKPLGALGTIQGHVLLPDDSPAPGVHVTAFSRELGLILPALQPSDAQGMFQLVLPPSTWWVAVTLKPGDPYMPYRLDWQTTVELTGSQVISDVVLRVRQADAVLHGQMLDAKTGDPAPDACGVVAAYQKGSPNVYSYAVFKNGMFDMAVVSGTYRLAVIPNPNLEGLGVPRPGVVLNCEAGRYLATSVRSVVVTSGLTTTLDIPLQPVESVLHNRFWDIRTRDTISGVGGAAIGWMPGEPGSGVGTWTAAVINPQTGVGDMPAAAGRYLIAYQLDTNAAYKAFPGIISLTVPPATPEMDVNLPVVQLGTTVSGTVVAPDGSPVAGAVVVATGIGLPNDLGNLPGPAKVSALMQHDIAVTSREDGSFVLNLNYGAYRIAVIDPPRMLFADHAPWISPAPTRLVLRPNAQPPTLTLAYRTGDATIHGSLQVVTTTASAPDLSLAGKKHPALVWAVTVRGPNPGHTRDLVMLTNGQGSYSLPAIQGQRWLVGAVYEVGMSFWYTATVVDVNSADISLDLALGGPHTLAGDARQLDPAQGFLSELPDGASVFVPGNLLGQAGNARVLFQQKLHDALAFMGANGVAFPIGGLSSALPAEGRALLSMVYEFQAMDGQGNPIHGRLNGPVMLRLPYLLGGSTPAPGRAPVASQETVTPVPVYFDPQTQTWMPVENYVVDTENQAVIVFAEQPGSYAVMSAPTATTIYLPLLFR